MKDMMKEVRKKVGDKTMQDLKNYFPTKNKFERFCKRHQQSPKIFFEEKLNTLNEKMKKTLEEKKTKIQEKIQKEKDANEKKLAREKAEVEAKAKALKAAKDAQLALEEKNKEKAKAEALPKNKEDDTPKDDAPKSEAQNPEEEKTATQES